MRIARLKTLRIVMFAGVAAVALGACANNRTSMAQPDFAGASATQQATALSQLAGRYKANPRDKATIIYYAAALRAAGQPDQATSVMENGVTLYKSDIDIKVAYAKALSASGRFDQALNVVDDAINPAQPDWNALLVKGAILDQSGRNAEARAIYTQALLSAPGEASLEANMGLSYAMSNDLGQAEVHLRKAVTMRHATSQIRQNLALVVGLQGRFDDARKLFAAELPPDQVEANMAYIRALLTQQNRWDLIKGAKG
ncbi:MULTISPECIES: tetratricopeptide repeat protein [unclassified Devosia]|uniref:tetratricopeptide repeat protein n=1 Tax=unclassified Devosia TaxID=196773 RepID=UPI000ACAD81A|nr:MULTISPECIES: tetratricopeptide repeat protein [unclassified Devosia]MBN9304503.1 tetratricopeptide repeat protein [Devosia sp.]